MTDRRASAHDIPGPYLVLIGDIIDPLDGKTGCGLVEWRREACVGQVRFSGDALDLGLPDMDPAGAAAAGARTMILGGAPFGGRLPRSWLGAIEQALAAGLNVASGLHDRLAANPALRALAERHGGRLIDVRDAGVLDIPVATGRRRSGRRVLTVGLDCAIGKKFTALSLTRDLRARGIDATFRATGQTGIMISGGGIAIDAVIADFIAGAAEQLSPDAHPDHWDVIEGQGSIFHPAYAGVSLGLLHGSQPDAIVLCHQDSRTHVDGYPDVAVADIETGIARHIEFARVTNPDVRCIGISLQTRHLPLDAALRSIERMAARTGLACVDPALTGTGALIDFMIG